MTTAQERKQQERQARRRRIQQAAREVFGERGYAKTSIEQIARQASLSVGAIYLYFRSKEDLYISLLEDTLDRFNRELSAIGNANDGRVDHRLGMAWSHLVGWATADIEGSRILRLMSQPGIRKQLSDEVATASAGGIAMLRRHFEQLIQGGIEAGVYHRHLNVTQTANLLWSLFVGLLETADARQNLAIEGPTFADAANAGFATLEASMRPQTRPVAEAA